MADKKMTCLKISVQFSTWDRGAVKERIRGEKHKRGPSGEEGGGLEEGSPAANSCPDLTFDFCEVEQL